MGGELGSLVASLLEDEPWVERVVGLDVDPPRRRLRRAEFHRIAPTARSRIADLVTSVDPHLLVHLGVYEPNARATATEAASWNAVSARNVIGAAAECPSLRSIVVRSGLEVYGRGKGAVTRPTEIAPIAPTSAFGRELAEVERIAGEVARLRDVPAALLRLAPVLGPHVPSPLGRLLRLPVVPFDLLADAPFAVIDDRDAAAAIVAAGRLQHDGALNLVAAGATTARHAAGRGDRRAFPIMRPYWSIVRPFTHLVGVPVPDHVSELLTKGRLADGSQAPEVLGVSPTWSTPQVIDALFAWESVAHYHPHEHPIPRSVA